MKGLTGARAFYSKQMKWLVAAIFFVTLTGCNATVVGTAIQGVIQGINQARAATNQEYTLVWLSRHAQKQVSGGRDPELTIEGQKAAQNLAEQLSEVGIDAIYSTPFKRTVSTAQPTANAKELEIEQLMLSSKEMALKIQAMHLGQSILVLGHSNTTPELIAALGATEPVTIGHDQYGDLFLVVLKQGKFYQLHKFQY